MQDDKPEAKLLQATAVYLIIFVGGLLVLTISDFAIYRRRVLQISVIIMSKELFELEI